LTGCVVAGVACEAWQFQCANGWCIDSEKLCDGHDDCADNSDEIDCSTFFSSKRHKNKLHYPSVDILCGRLSNYTQHCADITLILTFDDSSCKIGTPVTHALRKVRTSFGFSRRFCSRVKSTCRIRQQYLPLFIILFTVLSLFCYIFACAYYDPLLIMLLNRR